MSFRLFAQRLSHDWPNAWNYSGATVLLDRGILDQCPEKNRAMSLSRDAFLAPYTPEVIILLLGSQLELKAEGYRGHRSVIGLLLHRYPQSELNIKTALKIWKRVGLFIWSVNSERPEEEAIRSENPLRLLARYLDSLKTNQKPPLPEA